MSRGDLFLDNLFAKIEASGRRVTPQRAAVCEALLANRGHPTAAEIWQHTHRLHPSISQATVYNTIALLEELQLIRKLDIVGDEHAHYELRAEPHVNVVCTRCGRIADVYTDTLEALLALVGRRSGYELTPGSGVIVYGICLSCQRAGDRDVRVETTLGNIPSFN